MIGSTVIAELLRDGHTVRVESHGCSMVPTIRSGDVLLIEPTHASGVRCGDVVLSLTTRGLTAHRVVHIDRDQLLFTTRGDGAIASDEPFDAGALLGRVVRAERDGKAVAIRRPFPRFFSRLPLSRFLGFLG